MTGRRTPAIESNLDKFEAAIRKIGADPGLWRSTSLIQTVRITAEHAISNVVQELRRVLGSDELTQLRQTFVARSLRNVANGCTGRPRVKTAERPPLSHNR